MQTLRIRHAQAHNRQLVLTLPESFPENELEVIIMGEDAVAVSACAAPLPSDLDALFSFLASIPPSGRSTAEIDHQIQEERASWER